MEVAGFTMDRVNQSNLHRQSWPIHSSQRIEHINSWFECQIKEMLSIKQQAIFLFVLKKLHHKLSSLVVSFKQCAFPITNINLSIQQHKLLCIHFVSPPVQHSSISHGTFIKVKPIFHPMLLNGHLSIPFNPMKMFGFLVDIRRISHPFLNCFYPFLLLICGDLKLFINFSTNKVEVH